MTASEFAGFVLAGLVALILFFAGQRALVELTDNEDFAIPVQVTVDQQGGPELPSAPIVPPEVPSQPSE
ncbi:MAG TPA: hypothetical protein VEK39_04565 [Solirubrobacterales bacterium]|nr:hypothetical protein [Solirubrobacterales bacterium]